MKKIVILFVLLLGLPMTMSGKTRHGDVNSDNMLTIQDVTRLIDFLLTNDASTIDLENADTDRDGMVSISDVTVLVDYLLSGSWPKAELRTETFTVKGVSFTMVLVEGGTFMMGATAEQGTTDPFEDEYPVHEVTLSDYCIGQTEVTQELFMAVYNAFWPYENEDNPSWFSSSHGFTDDLRRPVETIHYEREVRIFLTNLYMLTGIWFRLPTEAEWEFAARGGNLSKGYKYSGSNDLDEVAWYLNNNDHMTQPVGTKKPNELGLYDMSGNVWEYCQDKLGTYSSEPQTNPVCTTGYSFLGRGGCFENKAQYCRVSTRLTFTPTRQCGLRLAI